MKVIRNEWLPLGLLVATSIILVIGIIGGLLLMLTGAPEGMLIALSIEALSLSFVVVIAYVGYQMYRADFSLHQQWSLYTATVTTALLFGLVLVLFLLQLAAGGTYIPTREGAELLILGASLGGALGGYATLNRTRAITRSDETAIQRDVFRFLNTALRHNVLNGINIVLGNARVIEESTDGDVRYRAQLIEGRGISIAKLIENAETIARFYSGEYNLECIDISKLLLEEVSLAHESFPKVEFDWDIEPNLTVLGAPLLSAAFDNLLMNAVEHNDSETPQVAVRAYASPKSVQIEIADNGPGVPDADRKEIFAPESYSESLGLYVVNSLVTACGGVVSVGDNSPRGAVFTVELPMVNSDSRPRLIR